MLYNVHYKVETMRFYMNHGDGWTRYHIVSPMPNKRFGYCGAVKTFQFANGLIVQSNNVWEDLCGHTQQLPEGSLVATEIQTVQGMKVDLSYVYPYKLTPLGNVVGVNKKVTMEDYFGVTAEKHYTAGPNDYWDRL